MKSATRQKALMTQLRVLAVGQEVTDVNLVSFFNSQKLEMWKVLVCKSRSSEFYVEELDFSY
jgi:hypothetical protein